jgi:serine phosphatase RsbU (regulator of sigma subunit)
MTPKIGSDAFENALLRTERLRILGVIAIIVIFGVAAAFRIYAFGSRMSHVAVFGAIGFVGYEVLVLRLVQRSIRSGPRIPDWFWTVNIVIEMAIPAMGVAFLMSDRLIIDYRPLATPWVLLFFPFLILSTLRLSPLTSSVAGLVGTLGYVLAATYHGWHIKSDLQSNSVTHTAVPFFALMICASGFIAALVASETRKHVRAALREADTKRQLEQLEHDLAVARSIQQSLLPKVRPKIDGLEVAGWNRSADATGGDFFDWKKLEDGRLAVTLADVTGHGIGPALLALGCRAYARASFDGIGNLATTLQKINRSLGEDLSPGRFATFVAAICSADGKEIEILSAGHAPLILYHHAEQTLDQYPAHFVPLGILPQLGVHAAQIMKLEEGDILFLVTDGFLEWENDAGEMFGSQRFAEVVRRTSHLGPEEIIAEIYTAVVKFSNGTTQQDDLTIVVIKRTGASAKEKPTEIMAATA